LTSLDVLVIVVKIQEKWAILSLFMTTDLWSVGSVVADDSDDLNYFKSVLNGDERKSGISNEEWLIYWMTCNQTPPASSRIPYLDRWHHHHGWCRLESLEWQWVLRRQRLRPCPHLLPQEDNLQNVSANGWLHLALPQKIRLMYGIVWYSTWQITLFARHVPRDKFDQIAK
jgi:hypothetical protein